MELTLSQSPDCFQLNGFLLTSSFSKGDLLTSSSHFLYMGNGRLYALAVKTSVKSYALRSSLLGNRHSLIKYLMCAYYVSGKVLGTRNILVIKD